MIKKDNYYYQFVKKYWFYKKSKSKKISTKELKSGCYSIEIKGENIYPVVKKLIIE